MSQEDKSKTKTPNSGEWLKYSGLAFQMFGILLIGWLGGSWIDSKIGFEKPIIGTSLTFIFLIAYFYKLIREFSGPNK